MSLNGKNHKRRLGLQKGSCVLTQAPVKDSLFDKFKKRKLKNIVILEGRPSLEAAKKSCKSLLKRKMTPTVIADNMAGFLFHQNLVKEVWISYHFGNNQGALCDIGASILGALGRYHNIPVYCYPAAKSQKFVGKESDLLSFDGIKVAPAGVKGYVPLKEWLPKKYITKIYE